MRKALLPIMLLVLVFLAACDNVNGGPDLSGTWTGTYANRSGIYKSTVTLTQSGNAISGELTAPDNYQPEITVRSEITGTLLDGTLKLTISDANAVLLTGKATGSSIKATGLFDAQPAEIILKR